MRGNQKTQKRLTSAGLAYVVLGCALTCFTTTHFFTVRQGGAARLTIEQAVTTHSLVFATMLFLMAGAVALVGALFLKHFRRS